MSSPIHAQPPLHQHGAFDDLDTALYNIDRLADALRGIGNLLQPEHVSADEQLNMARRSDASAVFECQRQIEMSAFVQSRNVRFIPPALRYGVARFPSCADLPTGIVLQG